MSISKPDSSMASEGAVEFEDRDPGNLNQHLLTLWDDVIAEPEGIRSPECAWRLTRVCFKQSKGFCYILLSVLIAPVLALFLGITFACCAFQHVWCFTPCLRIWKVTFAVIHEFLVTYLQAILRPLMETFGYLLYNIRVMSQKLHQGNERKEEIDTV